MYIRKIKTFASILRKQNCVQHILYYLESRYDFLNNIKI